MAEKHDRLVAKYRRTLLRRKYKIVKKSPFVDYRPDIYAIKNSEKIFVEVEIDRTLYHDHTLNQLEIMHGYINKNKKYKGVLVVPKKARKEASFLIESVFGDNKIGIIGL